MADLIAPPPSPVARRPQGASRERLGPLAKVPVFFDVRARRVIVAGGEEPAAWKAEMLAAGGAEVHVYAEHLCADFSALLAQGSESGTFVHHPRAWGVDDLKGAAIALCDAATQGEAQAFYCAARAHSVPCNVIDKPAFCDFQFGSIVNRSPIVIGISTDGAAPILGQAIRRRIETLLPPFLAEWGTLAKSLRKFIADRLEPGRERRAFWEQFADRAFGAPPRADEADQLIRDIRHIAGQGPILGHVTLVGAGPGDAELLTLKAVRALQAADVILFDDLVPDAVLELARREAKRMMVGKRGGRASCKQDDINALMVQLASQGKRVVRLKAGDPMVFGRAGEELAILAEHGISADVVPGISAGIALASRLGLSLSHRDHAHSIRFVTGHAKNGELPDHLDWRGLADPETTLIVYMGGRTSPLIAERLMREGLSASTPVVVAASVSQVDEHITHTTLGTLREAVSQHPDRPTVLGIGTVFGLQRRILAQASETDVAAVG